MRVLLAAILLLHTAQASAQQMPSVPPGPVVTPPGPAASQPAAPVDMSTFDRNLTEYARSLVTQVSPRRAIHLWHWLNREDAIDPKDTQPLRPQGDPRIIRHVQFTKHTFEIATGFGLVGPGYYAATDPQSSASFGDFNFRGEEPHWLLIQNKLRPGIPFLNFAKDISFPPELAAQIAQFGCSQGGIPVRNMSRIFSASALTAPAGTPTDPTALLARNRCLELRRRVVAITRVAGVKYNFGAAKLRGCTGSSNFAFMLFRDDALDIPGMVTFEPKLPATDDGHMLNRIMIQDLWDRAGVPTGPWPALWGMTPGFDMVRMFMAPNILACAANAFPEDNAEVENP